MGMERGGEGDSKMKRHDACMRMHMGKGGGGACSHTEQKEWVDGHLALTDCRTDRRTKRRAAVLTIICGGGGGGAGGSENVIIIRKKGQ